MFSGQNIRARRNALSDNNFITCFWKLNVFLLLLLQLREINDSSEGGLYIYITSEILVNHVIEKLCLLSFIFLTIEHLNCWKMSRTQAAVA